MKQTCYNFSALYLITKQNAFNTTQFLLDGFHKTNSNCFFNPLHLNIGMHILHTVLYTFTKVLTRRICLTIRAYLVGHHFLQFYEVNV